MRRRRAPDKLADGSRSTRELELVHEVALLLSADAPLRQLYDRLAELLGASVGAPVVIVVDGTTSSPHIAYVREGGKGGAPDDKGIPAGSAAEHALLGGEPQIYAKAEDWPQYDGDGRGARRAESAIFVPIVFGRTTIGVLSVQSYKEDAYDRDDALLLEICALQLGSRMQGERRRAETSELERLATTDGLTGVANRRSYDQNVAREWRRCLRSGEPLSLAIADIDYFKAFNDSYGHVAGDTCLRQVAQAIAHCARRPADMIARYGGEEFGLVLPATDAAGAARFCETVCDAVRNLAIPHMGSSLGFVTVSVGVYTTIPTAQVDPRDAISKADEFLYRAKESGRNRVAADGHVSEAPPVSVRAPTRHNLPESRTSFVGRTEEVATVAEGLRRGRLTTVVGPGGVGKTRIALEAARSAIEECADGVWLVDLAPATEGALVPSAVASAVGLRLESTQEPLAALLSQLRPLHTMLVFDTCEHLIVDVAQTVNEILRTCPNVRVLATSREPLRIAGESVYRLQPLDEPSAMRLFVERARDADDRFEPSQTDRESIAEICRRLDGIALAIELAAAHTRVTSPAQVLTLIDDRFRLLAGRRRADLPRHETVEALIDWSYALLSERERAAFRRLGVFRGGFTIEAASAVIARGDDVPEPLSVLFDLVDKSLVAQTDRQRYRLLDATREFAVDQLRSSSEEEATRAAHAAFFANESEHLAAIVGDLPERAWVARCEPDLDNFRAAIEWSLHNDVRTNVRLIASLVMLWSFAGLDVEGYRLTEATLEALGDDARRPEAAPVWIAAGLGAGRLFKSRPSLEAGETALELARALGDEALIGEALSIVGVSLHRLGDDPQRASAELRKATEIFQRLNQPLRASRALIDYGSSLLRLGELDVARRSLTEAAELARSSDWPDVEGMAEGNLAEVDFALGNISEACTVARRCVELLRGGRARLRLANALANLASYLAVAEHADDTVQAAREAIELAAPYEAEAHVAIAAQALALADALQEKNLPAARLLGFVDAVYRRRGAEREPTEVKVRARLLELLGAQMKPEELERELSAGAGYDIRQVADLAFGARA